MCAMIVSLQLNLEHSGDKKGGGMIKRDRKEIKKKKSTGTVDNSCLTMTFILLQFCQDGLYDEL